MGSYWGTKSQHCSTLAPQTRTTFYDRTDWNMTTHAVHGVVCLCILAVWGWGVKIKQLSALVPAGRLLCNHYRDILYTCAIRRVCRATLLHPDIYMTPSHAPPMLQAFYSHSSSPTLGQTHRQSGRGEVSEGARGCNTRQREIIPPRLHFPLCPRSRD